MMSQDPLKQLQIPSMEMMEAGGGADLGGVAGAVRVRWGGEGGGLPLASDN